jgi:protease-4
MAESEWFMRTFNAIKSGLLLPVPQSAKGKGEGTASYAVDPTGIAHIPLVGMMTKGGSSFGGASTTETRQFLRAAVKNNDVKAILLHVDTPGGTAAGTASLVDDIRAAGLVKPMHAHVEDQAASAGVWAISAASRITAERSSMIGSIGTFAHLIDTSGEFEQKGWEAHLITTGKYKGMGADGIKITDDQLDEIQRHVNTINNHFLQDLAVGRSMPIDQVKSLADGRVHDAADAVGLGLIDAVESIDDVVAGIRATVEQDEIQAGKNRHALAVAKIRRNK